MAFNPNDHDLEKWLTLEDENLLQKVCSIYDGDGLLVEEYKTRVTIVPKGSPIPHGANMGRTSTGRSSAPALYRAFNLDDDGNLIGTVPVIREWTQACEDISTGAAPSAGVPSGLNGLKLSKAVALKITGTIPVDIKTSLGVLTVPAGEEWYLRYVHVTSCNRGLYNLVMTNSEGSCEFNKRTTWTRFNETFNFSTADGGLFLVEGDELEMFVTSCGTIPSEFEAVFIVVKKMV